MIGLLIILFDCVDAKKSLGNQEQVFIELDYDCILLQALGDKNWLFERKLDFNLN